MECITGPDESDRRRILIMSIDRSLKTAGNLARHRNVLTRAERISKLKDKEAWKDGGSVFGLPKVAHRNAKVGKKEKKADAATPGKEGEAPAAAAAPAKTAAKTPAKK
jgi:small basic protein (TIGR04137 family)